MFDIGFAELLLLAVVGLLVLGPERLPGAIRTTSLWIGRLRRNFNEVRREIEREVGADEIRQQLHNESIMSSLKESEQKLRSSVERANKELKDLEEQAQLDTTVRDDIQNPSLTEPETEQDPPNKIDPTP